MAIMQLVAEHVCNKLIFSVIRLRAQYCSESLPFLTAENQQNTMLSVVVK